MRILVANVGSTSLKLRVIGERDRLEATIDLPHPSHVAQGQLRSSLDTLGSIDAVGHRIVHGGPHYTTPVLIDDQVLADLRALTDLAPLHQPPALDALDLIRAALPDLPTVACFDTAFHATLPVAATTYAVPQRWRDLGARRYGFHGLSHAWASRRALALTGLPASSARIVTCHLGGGASLAAVIGGHSVDTTMGFTPLEGLVMATRSGSVDPGLILWMQQDQGLSADEVVNDLEHQSGLLGLCGTDDMREVTDRDDQRAVSALETYLHRLRGCIAAMTAALGGLDALVFTGGVGEHSGPVRRGACAGLGFLGVTVDDQLNRGAVPDADISAPSSRARVLVIEAREDLEIASGVRSVVGD